MSHDHKPEVGGGGGIKEVLTSLTIAFAMALAFRGFVVEGFVIPTGSMAPTLLGMHMRFQAPENGADWTVGPWYYLDEGRQVPDPVQGRAPDRPVSVDVPHTGSVLPGGIRPLELTRKDVPRRSGDRIFVLKYLYQVFRPERFDVVVFKNPTNPWENYIKRLIGLPGEQIALVDGDVFVRPSASASEDPPGLVSPWEGTGWTIGRKNVRVQRDLWYPVFDSRYTPLASRASVTPPWVRGEGWEFGSDGVYRAPSGGVLAWDHERWPITDFTHYNDNIMEPAQVARPDGFMQTRGRWTPTMPVSDVRTLVSVEPAGAGLEARLTLRTRGHEFLGMVSGGKALLAMREIGEQAWRELDQAAVPALRAGKITDVEFWHVDQAVSLFIDGVLVCGGNERGAYEWGPAERIARATGLDSAQIARETTILFDGRRYPSPELSWSLTGSGVTVHRAGVWRDLYYQPTLSPPQFLGDEFRPARATHPSRLVTLAKDQFFVCGDNSAASLDSRLMSTIDPWVEHEFRPGEPGIIPRELLIGKAFFVYFPSIQWRGRIPVPDFGRMRFIR